MYYYIGGTVGISSLPSVFTHDGFVILMATGPAQAGTTAYELSCVFVNEAARR